MLNLSSTDAQIAASDYSKWNAAYADLSADTEADFHTKERSLNKQLRKGVSSSEQDDFKQQRDTNRVKYGERKEALKEMKEGLTKLALHVVAHGEDNGDCENTFFKEDLILSMHDKGVMDSIKIHKNVVEGTGVDIAPYSFDPTMWRLEMDRQNDKCLMNWACLRRVQWVKLRPHLISYLFDSSYVPRRKGTKRRVVEMDDDDTIDLTAVEPLGDDEEGGVPDSVGINPNENEPVTFSLKETWDRVKHNVRLSKDTGMMHFLQTQDKNGKQLFKCIRILTDRTKLRQTFLAYWHDKEVGIHMKSTKMHARLIDSFLGLPRRAIRDLILSTELDQVVREQGSYLKVTHPLQTSRPMEHWQMDLIQLNTEKYKEYSYVLVIIDLFSKKMWTHPLKTKHSEGVNDALKGVIAREGAPLVIQTDNGTPLLCILCLMPIMHIIMHIVHNISQVPNSHQGRTLHSTQRRA